MKRFEIITESDARVLPRGETVMLAKGGHVTPLAQDTLQQRRVTVVHEGARLGGRRQPGAARRHPARWRSPATTPASTLRQALVAFLRGRGLAVEDLGTHGPIRSTILTSPRRWRDTVARARGGRAAS